MESSSAGVVENNRKMLDVAIASVEVAAAAADAEAGS